MPFDGRVGYMTVLRQLYGSLYRLNVETDFVHPEDPRFEDYGLVIVPALYIADQALLDRIAAYVKGGRACPDDLQERLLRRECDGPRRQPSPGPLREACGFTYQEFTNLRGRSGSKGDPFKAGDANTVSVWAEYLVPETCRALARYDHPVFRAYPAVTRNAFGAGDADL